jgi:hypothetical protein
MWTGTFTATVLTICLLTLKLTGISWWLVFAPLPIWWAYCIIIEFRWISEEEGAWRE